MTGKTSVTYYNGMQIIKCIFLQPRTQAASTLRRIRGLVTNNPALNWLRLANSRKFITLPVKTYHGHALCAVLRILFPELYSATCFHLVIKYWGYTKLRQWPDLLGNSFNFFLAQSSMSSARRRRAGEVEVPPSQSTQSVSWIFELGAKAGRWLGTLKMIQSTLLLDMCFGLHSKYSKKCLKLEMNRRYSSGLQSL